MQGQHNSTGARLLWIQKAERHLARIGLASHACRLRKLFFSLWSFVSAGRLAELGNKAAFDNTNWTTPEGRSD